MTRNSYLRKSQILLLLQSMMIFFNFMLTFFLQYDLLEESPQVIKSLVSEYIEASQYFNPYKQMNEALLWSYAVFRYSNEKGMPKATGRVLRQPVNLEDTAWQYEDSTDSRYDRFVPIWELTFEQLHKAYDKARFDRYLQGNTAGLARSCFNRIFKRRIFWLYPDDGISSTIYGIFILI